MRSSVRIGRNKSVFVLLNAILILRFLRCIHCWNSFEIKWLQSSYIREHFIKIVTDYGFLGGNCVINSSDTLFLDQTKYTLFYKNVVFRPSLNILISMPILG